MFQYRIPKLYHFIHLRKRKIGELEKIKLIDILKLYGAYLLRIIRVCWTGGGVSNPLI